MVKTETWNSEYSIGVEKIDDQHKMLFMKLDDLLNAMRMRNNNVEIIRSLDDFERFVNRCFEDEEQIQRDIKYYGYRLQRQKHDEFRYKLQELRVQFENNIIDSRLIIKTENELTTWWIEHITNLDNELGKHLVTISTI